MLRLALFSTLLLAAPAAAQTDCSAGDCDRCGDGVCDATGGESCLSCAQDCGACCGDGLCEASIGEDCTNCSEDCGACQVCGDGLCNGSETCTNCEDDCGACCGDGYCDGRLGEACDTCAEDCGACCGDGQCGAGEDCGSCAEDCGACEICGDGACVGAESCDTCEADCGECPAVCGNGVCELAAGEDCRGCAADCGHCGACGDGICDAGESCAGCPSDCGACTCEIAPPFAPPVSMPVAYRAETPKLHGVHALIEVHGDFDAAPTAGVCEAKVTARGAIRVCGAVLGDRRCLDAPLRAEGSCLAPASCAAPPAFACDYAGTCCSAEVRAETKVQHTWKATEKLGPFACEVAFHGRFGGTFEGYASGGPGCTGCGEQQTKLAPDVTLSAVGEGLCRATLFGAPVQVPLEAATCARASARGGQGCGLSLEAAGGSTLRMGLRGMKIGWVRLGGEERVWRKGDGC